MKAQSKQERNRRVSRRARRAAYRLRERQWEDQPKPMLRASNIHYEMADRDRGLATGGLGAFHVLAQRIGLVNDIDERLKLLKVHLPYHESDHVLNIAYNVLTGGTCLEDLELRRNDEVYMDALGAQRIPDPTTAGDFCRRFEVLDVERLMKAINESRLRVWKQQPKEFFREAILDVDGTIAPTSGECKQGMGLSYDGQWGYHPLVISLANTQEPLFLENRSGNRPSEEGAPVRMEQAMRLCWRAGFERIRLRGDTAFSLTTHFDGWDDRQVSFIFGYDAKRNLVEIADDLPRSAWRVLERPVPYAVKTLPRQRPANIKEQIVVEKEYENIRLNSEHVAEFNYQPGRCDRSYRMIVVRKNLTVEKGEQALFDDVRYLFYVTNDRESSKEDVVFSANDRCNQENLIGQLKNGVNAMRMPVDNLVSNWAYMVMASLAWSLKAWFALLLPETGRWATKHKAEKESVIRMEFKKFMTAFVMLPAQIIRSGRRVIYRLMSWNRHLPIFFRGIDAMVTRLRC
jgi:hypothetical protein